MFDTDGHLNKVLVRSPSSNRHSTCETDNPTSTSTSCRKRQDSNFSLKLSSFTFYIQLLPSLFMSATPRAPLTSKVCTIILWWQAKDIEGHWKRFRFAAIIPPVHSGSLCDAPPVEVMGDKICSPCSVLKRTPPSFPNLICSFGSLN